jgi:hypothetical protein
MMFCSVECQGMAGVYFGMGFERGFMERRVIMGGEKDVCHCIRIALQSIHEWIIMNE